MGSKVILGILAALALAGSVALGQDVALPLIKAADVHRWIVKKGPIVLVDVRTPEEYRARHITGAVSIPLDEIPARADEVPRTGLVVLY